MSIIYLILVVLLIVAVVYVRSKNENYANRFRVGGYTIASYDPSMYPSEIERNN